MLPTRAEPARWVCTLCGEDVPEPEGELDPQATTYCGVHQAVAGIKPKEATDAQS